MADETVSVGVQADSKSFVQAFNQAASAVKNLASAGQSLVSGFQKVTANIVGQVKKVESGIKHMAVVTAVSFATMAFGIHRALDDFKSFETAMANVNTVMSGSTATLGHMSNAVMKMTGQMPQTAEELAAGLYEVQSAGFNADDALKVLGATAKFSNAGLVDMGTSVRGVASIINAYGLEASDAAHVTDVMFKAVEVGQMNASEFTNQIGDWSSIAATMGVSFETAAAAMAVLTTKGAMLAPQAATALTGVMRSFVRPSEEMSKAIKRAGFESGKTMLTTKGLADTLQSLWQASGKNIEAFGQMFQDTEGLKGALSIVGSGFEMMTQAQAEFNDETQTSGTVQSAFEKQMDTLAAKQKLVGNEIRRMKYEVGQLVAPLATDLTGAFASVLAGVNDLPGPIRKTIAVFQMLGPVIVGIGGMMMVWIAKVKLWKAATNWVATTKFFAQNVEAGKMTGALSKLFDSAKVKTFFMEMSKAGGPMSFAISKIKALILNTDGLRTGMLKFVGMAGLYAGAFAVVAIAVSSYMGAMNNAEQKAKAFRQTFKQASSGEIKSLDQLNQARQNAWDLQKKNQQKAGGSDIGNVLKGLGQMITPWTDNTVLDHAKIAQEAGLIGQEYQDLANAAKQMADTTSLSVDQVLDGLGQLASQGTADINAVIQATMDLQKLRNETATVYDNKGIPAYEAYIKGVKERLAQQNRGPAETEKTLAAIDTPALKLSFMSPEVLADYERYKKVLDDAAAAIEALQKKQTALDAAEASSSKNAVELAKAMYMIGDAASTTSEKMDAFSTINNQLLGNTLTMRDAQAGMAESIEKAGQAMVDNGANFNLATEGGQALQTALSAASKGTIELADATVASTGNVNDAIPIYAAYIESMVGTAEQAGFNQEQIGAMVAAMGMTPEVIQTLVTLPGIDPAIAQLLTTAGLLGNLDGYVAQAGVNITVTVDPVFEASSYGGQVPKAYIDTLPQLKAQDAIDKLKKSIMGNIPKTKGKGGGGGGGGGGAKKEEWAPSAEQIANMNDALKVPFEQALEGNLGEEWQKQATERYWNEVARLTLNQGKTLLGANIIKKGQEEGKDPAEDMQKFAEDYVHLKDLIGAANADIAANQFSTLDAFEKYIDGVEGLIKHQQDVEDWKADREDISQAAYRQILVDRLAKYAEFTDEWMTLTDKIAAIDKAAVDEEKRLMEARLAMGDISKSEYLAYLRSRLVGLEKYSAEYMSIWQEIQDLEKEVLDDTKKNSDTIKNFADEVKKAFDSIKRSVEEPIIRATSLIAAFGDQTVLTQQQVADFYSHMLEGTTRWVAVIKELKAKGVNQAFLNELIQAGPQSLSFAEQVLGMGAGGISMINQNMADIAALGSDLGTNIASGSVGTLNQIDNTISINVGDISITGEMPGGVTLDQVAAAITAALNQVATNVSNGQSVTVTV